MIELLIGGDLEDLRARGALEEALELLEPPSELGPLQAPASRSAPAPPSAMVVGSISAIPTNLSRPSPTVQSRPSPTACLPHPCRCGSTCFGRLDESFATTVPWHMPTHTPARMPARMSRRTSAHTPACTPTRMSMHRSERGPLPIGPRLLAGDRRRPAFAALFLATFRGMPTANDATLRFDLALGIRRRHAPKVAKKVAVCLSVPGSYPATAVGQRRGVHAKRKGTRARRHVLEPVLQALGALARARRRLICRSVPTADADAATARSDGQASAKALDDDAMATFFLFWSRRRPTANAEDQCPKNDGEQKMRLPPI